MSMKIRKNQPCPCGSGLKFKKCHGRADHQSHNVGDLNTPFRHALEQHQANEFIRKAQQGLGRPIISFKSDRHQIVAVRNAVYFSDKWKTFPDFLADYLKQKLDPAWGDNEIARPLKDRHPILQWYDAYCRYQQQTIKIPGQLYSAQVIGIVACYLGLAYSLYLLDHNVELQDRLIKRLKDPGNFQGAFYELFVANTLIRAGFELTIEDETDGASKHCEFAAVSPHTGKKYWVEAKMRAVAGLLGKNTKDGGSDRNPFARLIPHLNNALAKPAADERLIFIDLNTDSRFDDIGKPDWHDGAIERLEWFEAKRLAAGVQAYVFVTNLGFHRALWEEPKLCAAPFGLGMPHFNRPGYISLSEMYRQKQKHNDAHSIAEAIINYCRFPSTFDGKLPSEAFGGESTRVKIGETYFFNDVGENGLLATVTAASIDEPNQTSIIAFMGADGRSHLLSQRMSDSEFSDYIAHREAYFGKVLPVSKQINDRYSLFEWLMDTNKGLTRDLLLQRLIHAPNLEALKLLSDEDLRAEYCEAIVAHLEEKGIKPRELASTA